jgi:hypothetical protein
MDDAKASLFEAVRLLESTFSPFKSEGFYEGKIAGTLL